MILTELTLRLPNSPGAAASVCTLLAAEHVTIAALSLAPSGHLRLIVDNPVRASGVLREHHHQLETRDVLVVEAAASLAPALTLVAQAGINIDYAYTALAGGGYPGGVVLGVSDAVRAAAAAGV